MRYCWRVFWRGRWGVHVVPQRLATAHHQLCIRIDVVPQWFEERRTRLTYFWRLRSMEGTETRQDARDTNKGDTLDDPLPHLRTHLDLLVFTGYSLVHVLPQLSHATREIEPRVRRYENQVPRIRTMATQ